MEVYLLKVVVCSGLLYGYYRVALYNEIFHQWNRFYLLAAMVISVVAPLVNIPFLVEAKGTNEDVLNYLAVTPTGGVVGQVRFTMHDYLKIVIAVVAFVFLLRIFLNVIKIKGAYKKGAKAKLDGGVHLIVTKNNAAPFSFFNWLFWRENIDLHSENGQRMLQHELTHIYQKHTLDKLFTSFLLSLFWMNPFFWLMRRELNAVHEFLADKSAIKGNDGAAFAQMILLAIPVEKTNLNNLINPFFSSQIKRRLFMITTSKQPAYSYIRRVSGLAFMLALAIILSVSIQRVEAQQPVAGKQAVATSTVKVTVQNEGSQPKEAATTITLEKPKETKSAKPQQPPLYILDGKPITEAEMKMIDPNTIQAVNVFKGENAVAKFGQEGKNGVVEIISKKEGSETVKVTVTDVNQPIYYVNGEVSSKEEVDKLDKTQIDKINVLKGDAAVKVYGEKAKGGVIEIVMKKQPV